ncbi:MAG: DUF2188 domain-containing protein [Chitinophagales bacterium]|nr:DUF2188 domain-containing protein [Chitinophagales bacterium]
MSDIRESGFWVKLFKKFAISLLEDFGVKTRKPTHNQHVVPHEDGWAVKGAGNDKYTAVYDLQSEAIDRAKEIARNYKSTVIIHREDGTIRDSVSYR